jgi:bla regulator protein blaR1
MNSEWLYALANHLWQSTIVAVVAGLLVLMMRRYSARVRYWIWFAASIKFLVPFSLLISLGHQFEWQPVQKTTTTASLSWVTTQIAQPFSTGSNANSGHLAPSATRTFHLPPLALTIWLAGVLVIGFRWMKSWFRMRAIARSGSPQIVGGYQTVASPSVIEPGVFGIVRPVLLLPADIREHLSLEQLLSVLSHEACHIKRRDNLRSSIHMTVVGVFWFYPLVWWLGTRLLEERERACDEEVLRQGTNPEVYAESILRVCRMYLESPLLSAAGVSGSHLQKRIQEIVSNIPARAMDFRRACLLITAAVAMVAAPVASGVVSVAARSQAQQTEKLSFEVASVKLNKSGQQGFGAQWLPGGRFSGKNMPLGFLILNAFDTTPNRMADLQKLEKILNAQYDIEAVASSGAIPPDAPIKVRNEKLRLMLQSLLADRFKLAVHTEILERPVYTLVVAKGGPKLQKAGIEEKDCANRATNPPDVHSCHVQVGGMGRGIHGEAINMTDLVRGIQGFSDRPIIEKTGLTGLYNIQTDGWVDIRNAQRPNRPAETDAQRAEDLALADPSRPTLFAVLDGLGLKLETQTAPVEILFIDHVELPSEN